MIAGKQPDLGLVNVKSSRNIVLLEEIDRVTMVAMNVESIYVLDILPWNP